MRLSRAVTMPALVVAAAVLATTLSSCGGAAPASTDRVASTEKPAESAPTASATPTEPVGEITVGAVGFAADEWFPAVFGTVANTTGDNAMVSVNFAAYDAAGTVLGTTSGGFIVVRAGQSQQVIGSPDIPEGAVIARVDAQVEVTDSEPDPRPESAMTASQVTVSSDDFGSKVTGTIDSTYEQSVTEVYAAAVCTDAAGTPVAAGSTYVSGTVVPGTPAPYEILLSGPAPTACTVTATPSNLSEAS